MKIGDRIRNRRIELNLSQEDLAKRLGYKSRSSINKIENDASGLPQTKIAAIAKALNTTPAFIMGWVDDDQQTILPDNIIPMPKMRKIPLLGTIACGEPILAVENIEDEVDIPENINADFALRCKGDSMINARINDGDIVYIKSDCEINNGDIAAVIIEDEATLKRIYRQGNQVILQAENPAYNPKFFSENDGINIRIVGKAVGFTSRL